MCTFVHSVLQISTKRLWNFTNTCCKTRNRLGECKSNDEVNRHTNKKMRYLHTLKMFRWHSECFIPLQFFFILNDSFFSVVCMYIIVKSFITD